MSNYNYKITKYKFILPSLIIILFLTYIPLIYTFILSLKKGRGNNLTFSGFANYKELLSDEKFLISVRNSTVFMLFLVPLIILISIYLAYQIYKLKSEKLQNLFTTILYIPCITSPVAYSLFFKQIAYSDGILSNYLRFINILGEDFNILQNVWSARLLIIAVCIWAWTGYYTLLLFTAMKNIDPSIYKAAKIDGANNFKILRKIILPTIKPILNLITILVVIGTLQIYIESSIITKGGPSYSTYTMVHYLYNRAFTYVAQYGYSSAIGIVIFIICVIISIIMMKRMKNNEV
ncbi:MAG: sugar ABC transporter permease [Bacilli bacterium]|nr:sugar ABC transporter permease [Bacilli bacterium]